MAAPAPNPLAPERRRVSTRLRESLPFLLATIGLSLAAAVTDGRDIAEDAPPAQKVEVAEPNAYRWAFGGNSNAVAAGKVLERLLRQKISIVDRICRLTDAQKQKLLLAGRGDIKRFIDGVEEIGARMQQVKDDPDKVNVLGQESYALSRSLIVPGLPIGRLMFVNVLETTLTAEQLARYEPLRAVYRVGGLVQSQERGADEAVSIQINLNGTAFADDGLAHMKGLAGLKSLLLARTQVTDAGLEHLEGLTGLQTLFLSGQQVTDVGMEHLKGLTGLRWLSLDNTAVTDAGLEHLNGLTGLQLLYLNNTKVTDTGLAHLKGLTSLETLRLMNTQVTDAGLEHLKPLTKLKQLLLSNTRVTDSGVAELKRGLPGLTNGRR